MFLIWYKQSKVLFLDHHDVHSYIENFVVLFVARSMSTIVLTCIVRRACGAVVVS